MRRLSLNFLARCARLRLPLTGPDAPDPDDFGPAARRRTAGRRNCYTPELGMALRADYEAGLSLREVAGRHGLSPPTVALWLRRAGCAVRPRPHRRTPEALAALRAGIDRGLTIRAAAMAAGIPVMTAWSWLRPGADPR